MLLNTTHFIFHASFFKLICAKLGIAWTSAPKYQSNFSCCENFRKYNGSLSDDGTSDSTALLKTLLVAPHQMSAAGEFTIK